MNNQITVRQLLKYCQNQILIGNGDKKIILPTDEEGNGFRAMYYGFTTPKEYGSDYLTTDDIEDLGSTDEPIDNFIILG